MLVKKVRPGEVTRLVKSNGKTMNNVIIAAGWQSPEDVDLHAMELDSNFSLISMDYFISGGACKGGRAYVKIEKGGPNGEDIYYNKDPEEAFCHSDDCTDGEEAGTGDDERIEGFLEKINPNVKYVVFATCIYLPVDLSNVPEERWETLRSEAKKKHVFGKVKDAFFRFEDCSSGQQWQLDLTEDYSTANSVIGMVLKRTETGWDCVWNPKAVPYDINDLLTNIKSVMNDIVS